MDDECALGAQGREGTADEQDAARGEHANDLVAGSGRVGERSAEVEDGAKAQGAAQRPHGLHGGVVERREEEHESGGAQAFGGPLGG